MMPLLDDEDIEVGFALNGGRNILRVQQANESAAVMWEKPRRKIMRHRERCHRKS